MPNVVLKDGRRIPVDEGFTKLPPQEQQRLVNDYVAKNPTSEPPLPPPTVKGAVKSLGTGVYKAIAGAAGWPGDVAAGIDYGLRKAPTLLGYPERQMPERTRIGKLTERIPLPLPTTRQNIGAIEKYVRRGEPLYEGKAPLERQIGTVTETATTALGGPGPVLQRVMRQGVLPGTVSETAGQLTEGTALEPYARLAGLTAPAATRQAITPYPHDPTRATAAQTLQREGVDVSAGREVGSKRLQYAEADAMERQGREDLSAEQFTAASLRRIGERQSTRATGDVIDRNWTRIGNEFDDIARHNVLIPDPPLLQQVGNVWQRYAANVGATARAPIVANSITDLIDLTRSGQPINARRYQSYRSDLDDAARTARDDNLKRALYDLRNALDDGMERSMVNAGRNPDVRRWREARRQYANLMVVRDAVVGAGGEAAGLGIISPARLAQAASRGPRGNQFARGRGDFAELARAGQAVLTPLPNSGTAQRLDAMGIPAFLGAAAGGSTGDWQNAALGLMAGSMWPRLKGRTVMNPAVQDYLRNNAWRPLPGDPTVARMGALYGPRLLAPEPTEEER